MPDSVTIVLTPGPLAPRPLELAAGTKHAVGAVLVFEGLVRPLEDGKLLTALTYQAYEPMASSTLVAIAHSIVADHGLITLHCEHSTGEVAVGACSLRIVIASKHRKEGLAALDEFLDRLKRDVPIWKRPVWA